MKTNRLPQYWAVKNDGSQLFKDTVIKYLNDKYFAGYLDYLSNYYGETANDIFWGNAPFEKRHLLTLEQFIDMTTEKKEPELNTEEELKLMSEAYTACEKRREFKDNKEPEFNPKRGDRVMVSDGDDGWSERIFVGYIECAKHPVLVVYYKDEDKFKRGHDFDIMQHKYMKPY